MILDGYFNPLVFFGINGNIYVHQQRICHFLQGIFQIGNGLLLNMAQSK
jgi:hypothetical protein